MLLEVEKPWPGIPSSSFLVTSHLFVIFNVEGKIPIDSRLTECLENGENFNAKYPEATVAKIYNGVSAMLRAVNVTTEASAMT